MKPPRTARSTTLTTEQQTLVCPACQERVQATVLVSGVAYLSQHSFQKARGGWSICARTTTVLS